MAPVARRAVRWLPHPAPPPRARAPPSAARRHVRFDVATEPRRDVPTSVHAGEGAQRHDVEHHKRPATRRESEPCLGECGRSRSFGNVGSARVRLPHCMHPVQRPGANSVGAAASGAAALGKRSRFPGSLVPRFRFPEQLRTTGNPPPLRTSNMLRATSDPTPPLGRRILLRRTTRQATHRRKRAAWCARY